MRPPTVPMLMVMSTWQCPVQAQSCSLRCQPEVGYTVDGDVLIGGTFPVTHSVVGREVSFSEPPPLPACRNFNILSYLWALTMVFTIDEIHREQGFLPNISLGLLIYDSCLSLDRVLQGTVWMLTGKGVPTLNYRCQSQRQLAAVVGDSSSTRSVPMARLLGLYRYPQVSYYASIPPLSDKLQFPSFLRTVPNDNIQGLGISQLVSHFGWTWVGLLSTDNDYGETGSQFVKRELLKSGVCIAFHEIIPVMTSSKKIQGIVDVVKKSSSKVIIVYATEPYRSPVINELSRHNVTGKVWIAFSSLLSVLSYSTEVSTMLSGTLGFAAHEDQLPGFREFLLQRHPAASPNDIFAKPFWEEAFGCQWPSLGTNLTLENDYQEDMVLCSGAEDLGKLKHPYFNSQDLRTNYNIYNAIYVVAHALQDMGSCVSGHGPFTNKTCVDPQRFKPWQLLHYMKNVHFKNRLENEMFFDSNGDPPVWFDITNLQLQPDGTLNSVTVGSFHSNGPRGEQLHVNISAIQWSMQKTEVPHSVCSKSCLPGYRKAPQKGQPICCFDCVPCAEGEISNDTDSSNCWECPSDQWPNDRRNTCVPRIIEFLSYHEPLGASLAGMVTFSTILSAAIWFTFIKYWHTAVVKANNRELTYLLLGGLMMSFLCSFFFVGEPQPITCLLRQPAFGILFVFCVSCVLAKTIMVVIAFNATKPGSSMRQWLGPRVPVVTVSGCTLLQVLICATWLLLCPPFPEKNMKLKTGTIILQCNECSETALWCMLGYMGLLACVSFLVAFLARNLPDSFNEAKWITFSMLVFLSVWMSFVPGYLSTQGKFMVAVEVFGIISSSAGLLCCIFFPKCYIILLRPDLNTREHLLGKVPPKNR